MLIESLPLLNTYENVHDLECNGLQTSGNAYPGGIFEHFGFGEDGALITLKESDAATGGGYRTEMSFKPVGGMDPTGEMWYTWEFMIPASWGSSAIGFAIMQVHESPGDSVAVQFTLHFENECLVARVPVDVLGLTSDSYRVGNYPILRDRWYSMCLRANWKLDAKGSWELYCDRVPVLKRANFANAYDRSEGGYLKLGVYNFNGTSGYGRKDIYIRNVNIWSGNDGYQAIMAGVPLSLASRTL